MQVSHIGETGQTLHGLPMKEHRRAHMIGDPGWPEKTRRYARSQTVETAEYSCSLEWEPHSFLIVRAVVRHNVGGGDCRTVHVDRRKRVTACRAWQDGECLDCVRSRNRLPMSAARTPWRNRRLCESYDTLVFQPVDNKSKRERRLPRIVTTGSLPLTNGRGQVPLGVV